MLALLFWWSKERGRGVVGVAREPTMLCGPQQLDSVAVHKKITRKSSAIGWLRLGGEVAFVASRNP